MGSGLIWPWFKTLLSGMGVLMIVAGVWTFVLVHGAPDPIVVVAGAAFASVQVGVGMFLVALGVAA